MKQTAPLKIDKQLFIETIEAIEKQYRHDQKCNEAFKTILPNDYVSGYDNHLLSNQLTKLLQLAMNDAHKYSWIEYFMWELDFGSKYKEGYATNKDGSNIDLSTAGALYDFLITQTYGGEA